MKAEIEVLKPGLFSTIQDKGRFGFLKFGVPMSGPMDSHSYHLSNLILNNHPGSAVMEITQMGPVLKFLGSLHIVITGANLTPRLNDIDIRNLIPYFVRAGDKLSFGSRQTGCRCYLAVSGGFKTVKVLGSQSWYEGITNISYLEKGMILDCSGNLDAPTGNASIRNYDLNFDKTKIEVYPGPEFNKMPELLKKEVVFRKFKIDKDNNRMAIQLYEKVLNNITPLITGPVIPGTVQLTPSGKVIILMRDSQATGGYPRILQVSEKGINRLAQKVQGDLIQFDLKNEVSQYPDDNG